MKHAILTAVVLMIVGLTANAQRTYPARQLVLSNDTKTELSVCYAYQDDRTNIWTSVGWGRILAYSTATITIGIASQPTFFVHAQNNQGNIWGGDNYFCVSYYSFNIPNSDKDGCGNKARFRPIVLNNSGETVYSFHH